jgi:hypothetical protein
VFVDISVPGPHEFDAAPGKSFDAGLCQAAAPAPPILYRKPIFVEHQIRCLRHIALGPSSTGWYIHLSLLKTYVSCRNVLSVLYCNVISIIFEIYSTPIMH